MGKGWGVVGRDSNGSILFSYVQQASDFMEAELEETNACLLALKEARELSYRKIIVEGDYSSVILKLQSKNRVNTTLGFVIESILGLASRFDFCNFSHVRRMGNRVAHALAHLQPFSISCREWLKDGPDHVFDLALQDICTNQIS